MVRASLDQSAMRSHQLRNTLHTILLIGGTAALLGLIAWTLFGLAGVAAAAVMGGFGLWSVSKVSPKMVLGLYKARALGPDELPELSGIMRELTRLADLPAVPQLYYVPSQMMNAFAVGRPEDSAVAITDGLLRGMSHRQLKGILAHEVAHIRSGDLKVMALADVMNRAMGVISMLGILGVPAVLGFGLRLPWLAILLMIAAPQIGALLQLALSRAREYDADLDAVELTGDPEGLASALRHLERKQRSVWEGIVLPGSRIPNPSLLRTHPKTEDRIARLMALRTGAPPVVADAEPRPVRFGPSIVPPVRRPRVHVYRMGVWY